MNETPGKTPIILLDIPGTVDGNILMYGHLDKQPEMERMGRWSRPLDPGNER